MLFYNGKGKLASGWILDVGGQGVSVGVTVGVRDRGKWLATSLRL
jgi:hypothetical protein